jgi:S1-C subfamily serine protease
MSVPTPMSLSSLSSAIAGLAAQTTPSIISVRSHRSRASGFVWKSGLVVTADETLAEQGDVSVKLPDGQVVSASIAGRDHTTDIALLRLDTREAAAARFTQDIPALGSLAVVMAADRGVPTAALGLVSLIGERWRSLRGGEIDSRIELNVEMRHHHQGGLALDAAGQAIGMVVLGPRRVIVIPAATIVRVAAKLESHGRIARGYLGVGLQAVKLDNNEIGAMVMGVDSAGPSAAAGLRQGDVIVSWNGERLAGVRTLLQTLGPESVGSVAEMVVRRAGEPAQFRLTIGERPEA